MINSNLCSIQIAKQQLNPAAAAVADRPICRPRKDQLPQMRATSSSSSPHSAPTLLSMNNPPVVRDYLSCHNKTSLLTHSRDNSCPSKTVYLDNKHDDSSGNPWGIQVTVLSAPTSPDSDTFSNAAADDVAQIPSSRTHVEDADSPTTNHGAALPHIESSGVPHDIDVQSQQPPPPLEKEQLAVNTGKTLQNLSDDLFVQQRFADKGEDGKNKNDVTADDVLERIESDQGCMEDDYMDVSKGSCDRDEDDEGDTGMFWHANLPGIFSRPSRPIVRRARTEPGAVTGTRTAATIDDRLAMDEAWATKHSLGDSITDLPRTERGSIRMQKFHGVLKRNPPSDSVMSAQLRQSMLASSKVRDAGSTVQRSRVWHVTGMASNSI